MAEPIQTAPTTGEFLVWIPSTSLWWPAYAQKDGIRSNAHGMLNAPEFPQNLGPRTRILRATHWMPMPSAPDAAAGT